MSEPEPVGDPADPRLAVFLGLRDHAVRQRREQRGGDMAATFVAEGDVVIERAIAAGHPPLSVLVSHRRTKPLPTAIPDSTEILVADDIVLETVTGRPELRDPLASFARKPQESAADVLDRGTRFAVLEGVNNPNNLGVIARNAAALGIDGFLLDPTCGDPLYRRAIRASMGQIFAVPHARLDAFPDGLDALHDRAITTIALTPRGDVSLADIEAPGRVAVVLGAEGPGLPMTTLARTTIRARIDMDRGVDSLNVAAAAAIAFYALR